MQVAGRTWGDVFETLNVDPTRQSTSLLLSPARLCFLITPVRRDESCRERLIASCGTVSPHLTKASEFCVSVKEMSSGSALSEPSVCCWDRPDTVTGAEMG